MCFAIKFYSDFNLNHCIIPLEVYKLIATDTRFVLCVKNKVIVSQDIESISLLASYCFKNFDVYFSVRYLRGVGS